MAIKLVVKLSVAQRGFAINGYSHIIIDEDGVGGGVVDQMQGVMAKNPIAAPSHELRRYLLDRALDYFQQRGLDGLAGWFGREFHRLLSKGIDAAASFRSWFIDHRHFDESRDYKLTGFIQLLVANRRQVFHDGHLLFGPHSA